MKIFAALFGGVENKNASLRSLTGDVMARWAKLGEIRKKVLDHTRREAICGLSSSYIHGIEVHRSLDEMK